MNKWIFFCFNTAFIVLSVGVKICYNIIYLRSGTHSLHNFFPCKLKSWVYRDIKCDLYMGMRSTVVSVCNFINHVCVTGNWNTEWFQVPGNLEFITKALNQERAIWTHRLWISKNCMWSNVCKSTIAKYLDGVKLLRLGYMYNTHTHTHKIIADI